MIFLCCSYPNAIQSLHSPKQPLAQVSKPFLMWDNAIPGNIEGQVALGSEQSDPVEGVPAHCKGIGADEF